MMYGLLTRRWGQRTGAIPFGLVVRLRVIFHFAAVIVAISGTGCARGMWQGIRTTPADAHVLPVAGQRQVGSRCGSNALSTLLAAAGERGPESEVGAAIQNQQADAALTVDLLLYARSRGFPADFDRGNRELLFDTLTRGEPCLLLLNLEPAAPWPMKVKPMWHYVVAYGFSRSKQIIYVHSGVGPKAIRLDKLDAMWKPGGFWMMHLGVPLTPTR